MTVMRNVHLPYYVHENGYKGVILFMFFFDGCYREFVMANQVNSMHRIVLDGVGVSGSWPLTIVGSTKHLPPNSAKEKECVILNASIRTFNGVGCQ
jgi:hypothetical protein